MSESEIVSDAEIERVHGNANFGGGSKRDVLRQGVWNAARGYSMGSTMRSIIIEHGLAKDQRNRHKPPVLTEKGMNYLRCAKIEWPSSPTPHTGVSE